MLLKTDFLPILKYTVFDDQIKLNLVAACLALALDWLRKLELLLDSIRQSVALFALKSAN